MRTKRRDVVVQLLLAAAVLWLGTPRPAYPADEALPRVSVESGRIEVRRSDLAAPEISAYVQDSSAATLSAPTLPGRRTIVESTILGQDSEWGGFKPRLRLGYGFGDGASPATSYRDVYIRGVLIKEFD
jgi:hypothetical protein